MLRTLRVLIACTATAIGGLAVSADNHGYQLDVLSGELNMPWCVAFLPDNRLIITELGGTLRLWQDGELSAPIEGVPAVYRAGQGGLFDVLVDPNFAINGRLYLSFAHGTPGANATRIVSAKLDGNRLIEVEPIYTVGKLKKGPVHYGGRMTWLNDGSIAMTTGDGFDYREEAQNTDNAIGAVVRLNPDGSLPGDNPFADGGGDASIYTYGHRNAQGIALHPNGTLFMHEHGARGGDEINALEPGNNYGWPLTSHGIDYNGGYVTPFKTGPGVTDPEWTWVPSIAPAGLAVVTGDAFPEWEGNLLVAALVDKDVKRLEVDGSKVVSETSLFSEIGERIRDVRIGPDNLIYLLTDSPEGQLIRVSPAG